MLGDRRIGIMLLAAAWIAWGLVWTPSCAAQAERSEAVPEKPAAEPAKPQEKPPAADEEKPADEAPPKQDVEVDPTAEPPKGKEVRNFLQRLLFGPILGGDEENPTGDGEKKLRRTDPRIPFNSKLSTLLKKAQTQVKANENRQAVETLQHLLEMPDDALFETSPGQLKSIRSAAHKLLSRLPAEELDRYRQRFGGAAARELKRAREIGSPTSLAQVATRYFQTDAGFQAANQLATRHLDRGEFGLAGFWFRELLESDAPLTRDPVWQLKAEFVARKIESSALKKLLAERTAPGTKPIVIGGQPIDRDAWLAKVAQRAPSQTPLLQEWPQFFGSARRVGQAAEGEPLLLARWSHPMTLSLAIHERLSQLISDLRDQNQTPVFTFVPLLVDGKIVFRSLRGVKVISADSGKLLWETADTPAVEDILSGGANVDEDSELAEQFGQHASMINGELDESSASDNPLTHLLFRNANHGLLSSAGRRLFVVEDLSVMTGMQPGQYWGEELPENDPLGRPLGVNRLTAYDLQTGRNLWEVGGPNLNDPFELPLSGSFFFGAPVADAGDLFVVAEKDGVIRLHVLDEVTGKPRWSQVIANAQARINMDVGRQWLSAPVAVGDGVVVCPTTIGWLVAIDRSTHGILWAYRYQDMDRDEQTEPQDQALPAAELNDRWAAAPPVIVDDRVIFTPPEESRMICVGLSDGQQLWSQSRKSALYLAGVFNGQIITVSNNSITSTNLKDGKLHKSLKFKSADARPAGRGVAVQDRYYLPLTTGELVALNLKTMTWEPSTFLPPSSKPELQQFGNLAMYRGMLLSLSPHGLATFEPKLSIVAELQQQLAQDPKSTSAAIRKAELELLSHHYQEARTALIPVQQSALSGELKQRYRAAMLTILSAQVREDLAAHDSEFDEMARLAELPAEVQSVDKLRAERLLHRRDYAAAFAVYAKFARDFGPQFVNADESGNWQVRGDQWAAARLAELFVAVPADVRPALDQLVEQAAASVATESLVRQQEFLDLYQQHPAILPVARRLIENLATASRWQTAENLLLRLQSDPAQRMWTTERLARLCQQAGLSADAAYYYSVLEKNYGAAPWDATQTVSQLVQARRAEKDFPISLTQPLCDWHNRDLKSMRAGSNFDNAGLTKQFNLRGAGLPYFRQHRLQFILNEPRFEITDAVSEKRVWSLPVRSRHETAGGPAIANVEVTGHQVVLFEGGTVYALSPVQRQVLWTHVIDEHLANYEFGDDSQETSTPSPMSGLRRSTSFFSVENFLGDDWGSFVLQGSRRLANERYTCYLARRELVVLDSQTGAVMWRRDALPTGLRLLGGSQMLYAWNPAQETVTAYRVADGAEVKIPKLTEAGKNSIISVGDDFVVLDKTSGRILRKAKTLRLRRLNPLSNTEVWGLDLPKEVLATPLSGDRLALLDAQGLIQICDLETGMLRNCGVLPKTALQPDKLVYIIPTYDQVLAIVHQESKFANDRYGETFPSVRVAGTVYSFELETGKEQWKQAVSGLHLILEQLDHSPLVLLLARTFEENGSNWKLSLLAIDRQHGKVVHQSDMQVQSSFHQMSVNMQEEFVELRTYNDRLRLYPTAKSASAAP